MKEQIIQWFQGNRDYNEGLELLKANSRNAQLILFLSRGCNKATSEKLLWELHKIGGVPEKWCYNKPVTNNVTVVTKKSPQIKKELRAIKNGEKILTPLKELPKIIQDIIREKGELIRKRAVCHSEMGEIIGNTNKDKSQRKKLREDIDNHTSRINEIVDIVALYDRKGILPSDKIEEQKKESISIEISKENDVDKFELMKMRNSLRSQVSKAKNKIENSKGEKKKIAEEKFTLLEKELNEIEQQFL